MLFALIFLFHSSSAFALTMPASTMLASDSSTLAFQESLTWAREQAAKIKDQIATVEEPLSGVPLPEKEDNRDSDQPDPSQDENPVCRRRFGELPCTKKSKAVKKPMKGQKLKAQPAIGKTIFSPSPGSSQGKMLVFISLSMPKASLKSLAQETERYRAVLILRGLVNDSFKETAEALQSLDLVVEINPEAFTRYNVQQVPTFIKIDPKDQEIARLQGNVTLSFAQQKFEEKGS